MFPVAFIQIAQLQMNALVMKTTNMKRPTCKLILNKCFINVVKRFCSNNLDVFQSVLDVTMENASIHKFVSVIRVSIGMPPKVNVFRDASVVKMVIVLDQTIACVTTVTSSII